MAKKLSVGTTTGLVGTIAGGTVAFMWFLRDVFSNSPFGDRNY